MLWVTDSAMAGLSARGVAIIVLLLGFAACQSAQAEMARVYGFDRSVEVPRLYAVGASLVGLVSLGAGVVALVTGGAVALALLVGSTAVLWAMATVRHLLGSLTPTPHSTVH
jgi:hypothetical protein